MGASLLTCGTVRPSPGNALNAHPCHATGDHDPHVAHHTQNAHGDTDSLAAVPGKSYDVSLRTHTGNSGPGPGRVRDSLGGSFRPGQTAVSGEQRDVGVSSRANPAATRLPSTKIRQAGLVLIVAGRAEPEVVARCLVMVRRSSHATYSQAAWRYPSSLIVHRAVLPAAASNRQREWTVRPPWLAVTVGSVRFRMTRAQLRQIVRSSGTSRRRFGPRRWVERPGRLHAR